MKLTRSTILAIGIVLLVAVLVAGVIGWRYFVRQRDVTHVTAQFDSAAGLYVGNKVAVLGMPVGKVTRITPKGGYVEVEFTVDRASRFPRTPGGHHLQFDPHRPSSRTDAAIQERSEAAGPRHHRVGRAPRHPSSLPAPWISSKICSGAVSGDGKETARSPTWSTRVRLSPTAEARSIKPTLGELSECAEAFRRPRYRDPRTVDHRHQEHQLAVRRCRQER